MKDCPHCLFSSGIVADGKGTKCKICGGSGKTTKKIYEEYKKQLGDE